jgi:hypothetical protein
MDAIYTKLQTWLTGLVPAGCAVIVADQNAPTPALPLITYRVRVNADIARDFSANVRDLNADQPEAIPPALPLPEVWALDVVRWVRLSVDVQAYGRTILEAESIAQGILDFAYNQARNTDVLGRSVAFNLVVQSPQTIDGVIGAKFEPRVVMTLGFSASRQMVYDVGAIDTVFMEGQVETQTVQSEASE